MKYGFDGAGHCDGSGERHAAGSARAGDAESMEATPRATPAAIAGTVRAREYLSGARVLRGAVVCRAVVEASRRSRNKPIAGRSLGPANAEAHAKQIEVLEKDPGSGTSA